MSLLIRNGRVITPERDEILDIFIAGETIAALGPSLPQKADSVIDASKLLVIPGGIDPHTHLNAPVGGTISSDDFESGTRAAAFGGTTSIIDFATQEKGGSLQAALDLWHRKAERSTVDYAFHMIIADASPPRIEELGALTREGVTSFKVFMAYPGRLMCDDAAIIAVMEASARLGALVCVHAENGTVIEYLIARALEEGKRTPIHHALTRPAGTEAEATHRALRLAEIARAPVYIVHISCKEAAHELRLAVERGVTAYGETCPHYLLLGRKELDRPEWGGARFVLTPPLRDPSHHDPLWRALAENGLQTVGTDHCPFHFLTQKLADTTDFTRIPNGGPGIEHRLQLLYHHGVRTGRLTLRRWVDLVSTGPARIFGLYPRKGTIAVGSDADIVLWNPEADQLLSASTHHMNVDYSMYEGMRVHGNAETVISRGELIIQDGRWLGRPGRGKFLTRATVS